MRSLKQVMVSYGFPREKPWENHGFPQAPQVSNAEPPQNPATSADQDEESPGEGDADAEPCNVGHPMVRDLRDHHLLES